MEERGDEVVEWLWGYWGYWNAHSVPHKCSTPMMENYRVVFLMEGSVGDRVELQRC